MTRKHMAPLPTLVIPFADEPILGVMTRLSHVNRYYLLNSLARKVGLSYQGYHLHAFRPDRHGALGERADLDADELFRCAYLPVDRRRLHYFGVKIRRELVSVGRRKACPLCLAERPYHRAFWDLTPIAVCHRHGIRLRTGCHLCPRPLQWMSGKVTTCRCGADMRRAPCEPVSAAADRAARTIAARFRFRGDGDALNNRLFGLMDGPELLWFMLGMANHLYNVGSLQAPRTIWRNIEMMPDVLGDVHDILMGWPRSLAGYFSRVQQHRDMNGGAALTLGYMRMCKWARELDCWPDIAEAVVTEIHRHFYPGQKVVSLAC